VNSQVGQKSEGRGGEEKPENDKNYLIFNFIYECLFMNIKTVIENVINF
jgi:hypothetical protein